MALNHNVSPSSPAPIGSVPAYWVGPRHLAGDDGRLYDTVADALTGLGWTSLTLVRGRLEPEQAEEELGDRVGVRSTVLHISPDGLRWAQWMLADESFQLGGLPIAWQICAREDGDSTARWSAYFTTDVPGEAVVDFLAALDARDQPATGFDSPELVMDTVTAHGWLRDVHAPATDTIDPTFTGHLALGEVPPLIQDGDPRALLVEAGDAGATGWQAWVQPGPHTPYLWAASFSASVPHDLTAAFAASISSSAPVLRRRFPESTKEQLLRAPAG